MLMLKTTEGSQVYYFGPFPNLQLLTRYANQFDSTVTQCEVLPLILPYCVTCKITVKVGYGE